MKRIIILLAAAFFALTALAQTNSVVKLKTPLGCFISDASTSPTNIRKSPGGEVIGSFKPGTSVMIDVIAKSGKWFQFEVISNPENETINMNGKTGWLHSSVIGLNTANYGGQRIPLYSKPNMKSPIVAEITEETLLHPEDIEEGWVKVTYKDKKSGKTTSGWIERVWLCGNSVTNCC